MLKKFTYYTLLLLLIYSCKPMSNSRNNNKLQSNIINPKFITYLDYELLNYPVDSRIFSPLTSSYSEKLDFAECGSFGYEVNRVTDLDKININYNYKALRIELYSYEKQKTKHSKDLLSVDFQKFKNIEFLDITSNYIDTIPKSIFTLKNLKIIKISCPKVKILPDEFENLENLENLILDYNYNLIEIPESIKKLNKLKRIEIAGFEGDNLPFKLHNFPKLRDFRLRNTYINTLNLEHNTKLETVYLTELNLDIIKLKELKNIEIFQTLNRNEIEKISKLKNLVELSICVDNINDIEHLTSLPHLKFLHVTLENYENFKLTKKFKFNDLEYFGLSSRNMSEIDSNFLSHFSKIKYLNIWCKKSLTYKEELISKKGIEFLKITGIYDDEPKEKITYSPKYKMKVKKVNIK